MKRLTKIVWLASILLSGCASSVADRQLNIVAESRFLPSADLTKTVERSEQSDTLLQPTFAVVSAQPQQKFPAEEPVLASKDISRPPIPFSGLGSASRWLGATPTILVVRPDGEEYSLSSRSQNVGSAGFDIRDSSVVSVVDLIYSTAIKTPYVLAPEIMRDQRPVSFRWSSKNGDLRVFMQQFLGSLGYKIESKEGVDYVSVRRPSDEYGDYFVYRPQFRSVRYLTNLVAPYFSGYFGGERQVSSVHPISADRRAVPSGSAAALIDQESDTLIFKGSEAEISQLKSLIVQLDVPGGEILVRGLVYEVGVNKSEGSAFSIISSLFGGKLNLGVASGTASPIDNFVTFKNATIDMIANVLSNDSRFKVVSSPSIRMTSGVRGRFSVGQDVPVLGSVSYDGNGKPVQSVEYRSSGVIFDVLPSVYESKVVLDIHQELSNFVRTETGVDGSPTLTKRELNTTVSVADQEVIILGGLAEYKDNNGSTGFSFLPDFMRWNTSSIQRSEIVLVVQVQRL